MTPQASPQSSTPHVHTTVLCISCNARKGARV